MEELSKDSFFFKNYDQRQFHSKAISHYVDGATFGFIHHALAIAPENRMNEEQLRQYNLQVNDALKDVSRDFSE